MISVYDNLPDEQDWMNFYKSNRNFFHLTSSYIVLNNVYVSGSGALVFDEDLNLVDNVLHEVYYWTPNYMPHEYMVNKELLSIELLKRKAALIKLQSEILMDSKLQDVDLIDEAVYLLHAFAWYPFGHLNDSLLRLKSLEDSNVSDSASYLVSNYDRVIDFKEHLKALIGYMPQIIEMPKCVKLIKVKKLWVPISESTYTTFTRDNYIWMRDKYINYFGLNDIDSKARTKLYLSRNHVSPGSRMVINEEEIKSYLHSQGFMVVYGNEPLSSIVDLFYRASVIVGYHGSLFANTFFCQSDCAVLEFCAKNREDHSFQHKYKLVSDYTFQLVDADANFNASIDQDLIEKFIFRNYKGF